MRLARLPANRLPKVAMLTNAIVYKLNTRPRLSSSTIVCKIVLLEVDWRIKLPPSTNIASSESQSTLDKGKDYQSHAKSGGRDRDDFS